MTSTRPTVLSSGKSLQSLAIVLGSFACCVAACAQANDKAFWPRFHGPNGDNISTDTGLLKSWPEDGPDLAWSVEGIGEGYSSVTMANGIIYTVGNQEEQTVISAIDMDGKILWQVPNGKAWTGSYPGTRGTPTIDGNRIYHQSPVGNVICLDAKSGDVVWSVNALQEFGGENITWALAESLLVDGDNLICCPGGKEAAVVALNKANGQVVWKSDSVGEKANYATPSLIEANGLRIVLTMTQKHLIGVNADSGKLLFQHPFETKYDINALKPLYHDGHIFISGGYGTTGSELLKLAVSGSNASVEKVWGSRDLDNHHGGVLLIDGYLYGASHNFNNAKWICLDWKTGEMKWAERAVGKGSATYADGLFYLFSERRGAVGLAKGSPDGLELVGEFRLPSVSKDASWAHPVVCGGRLYLRWGNHLFAYDVSAN